MTVFEGSRRLFLRAANKLLADKPMIAADHAAYHFSFPSICRPKTFTDFIHYRKLFDRDLRLPVFADKVSVKQQVATILGKEWVTPSIWVGESAAKIPFDMLPPGFALKANHGANMNFIAHNGCRFDKEAVRQVAAHWLNTDFGRLHREWAYTQIPRKLLVEPLIRSDGKPLVDYKFYVLGGKVAFIDVKLGRSDDEDETSAIMDAAWRRLPFRYGPQLAHPSDPTPPKSLSRLIEAAEEIGRLFDFVRVDLYDIEGKPLFGEVTFYPSAGLARFSPEQYDEVFGHLITHSALPKRAGSAAFDEVKS